MKFVYVDESISDPKHANRIFVMAGLMVDAYKLRKVTSIANAFVKKFLEDYKLSKYGEIKASKFLNNSKIGLKDRKQRIMELCKMIPDNKIKICGIAILLKNFSESVEAYKNNSHIIKDIKQAWHVSAVFISSLIQKKMTKEKNKGLTVLIFDDHKKGIYEISEFLNFPNSWFDIHQEIKNNKPIKKKLKCNSSEKFDKIINTAFSIKSHHSSLIQFADVVCYVYRRWLELKKSKEKYPGEKNYYQELIDTLEGKESKKNRMKIGKLPDSECTDFYKKIKHPDWVL